MFPSFPPRKFAEGHKLGPDDLIFNERLFPDHQMSGNRRAYILPWITWPFTDAGLRDQTTAPALLLLSFQMQSPYISGVCLSPQKAAFSVHPWKWSHRTPTNSLMPRGPVIFTASFVPAQHPRELLLSTWLTTASSRRAPLPSGTHISHKKGRRGKTCCRCLGLLKWLI